MATTHTLASPAGGSQQQQGMTVQGQSQEALAEAAAPTREEARLELRGPLARLPVELDVAVPVRDFRVRNLLALAPGHLVESRWGHGADVPVFAGDVQLAWSEFEVVDTQLAVRVTRLI